MRVNIYIHSIILYIQKLCFSIYYYFSHHAILVLLPLLLKSRSPTIQLEQSSKSMPMNVNHIHLNSFLRFSSMSWHMGNTSKCCDIALGMKFSVWLLYLAITYSKKVQIDHGDDQLRTRFAISQQILL